MIIVWIAASVIFVFSLIACFLYFKKELRITRNFKLEGSLENIKQLILMHPGNGYNYPNVKLIEWIDEGKTKFKCIFDNNISELYIRDLNSDNDLILISDGALFNKQTNKFVTKFLSCYELSPIEGGVKVKCAIIYENLEKSLLLSIGILISTLGMPSVFSAILKQSANERNGLVQAQDPPGALARLGGWPTLMTVAAVGWFIYDSGLWGGFVLLSTLVIHEYGHFWAMRRNGQYDAKIMLVPFFGGVAYSSQPFRDDRSNAEITLMGPIFGFLIVLLFYAAAVLTNIEWFFVAALSACVINGFNLLPIPPLDGGGIAQLFLRRIGERTWLFASIALAIGGALIGAWLRSPIIVVFFVLTALVLSIVRRPPVDRPMLSNKAAIVVATVYFLLVAAHVTLGLLIYNLLDTLDFEVPLAGGPFQ